ncbi:MAG TPA: hypothetical protein VFS02_03145 [Telluria sp.]|nr:hypothetical protein [Telluria sp.]
MGADGGPLFDAEHAAFMQSGISLHMAACGAELAPSVARALGCRIAPQRTSVRLLVSRAQGAALLAHVGENGRLAAVFSEPSSHRTVQLKATDATVEAAGADDIAAVARYRDAFVAHLETSGYNPALIRAFLACPDSDLCAIRFTPCAAFSQTPGAGAGEALRMAP